MECTYRAKGKKKWLEGSLTVDKQRVVLLDAKGSPVDHVHESKLSPGSEEIATPYYEIFCDQVQDILAQLHPSGSAKDAALGPAGEFDRGNVNGFDRYDHPALAPVTTPAAIATTAPASLLPPKKSRHQLLGMFGNGADDSRRTREGGCSGQ